MYIKSPWPRGVANVLVLVLDCNRVGQFGLAANELL